MLQAAGKQLIFMSGHASKIGNDVSQALFDGRMVPDSTTYVSRDLFK